MTDNEKYALTYTIKIKELLLPMYMNCKNPHAGEELHEKMGDLCLAINRVAEEKRVRTVFPKGTVAMQREIDAGKWDEYLKK